jgi:predicted transcriptional regulator
MSIANALKKAASKTLSKLGGDVTIRRVTAGSYNTTTGAITESTSDTTIKGAIRNVTRNQVNDLIESQDKILTISAGDLTFVPTTKDRVVISSVEFKIISVVTNEQNNTPISFELVLR